MNLFGIAETSLPREAGFGETLPRNARSISPFKAWAAAVILVLCLSFGWGARALAAPESGQSPLARAAAVQTQEQQTPPPAHAAAGPATVTLKNRELTVDAKNSDLGQILHRVAALSGMTIHGLGQTTRIFGVYGPGNPSDVLANLLDGSGYNFVMAGRTADGAPRELVLTVKNNAPLPAPTPPPVAVATPPPAPAPAPPPAPTQAPQQEQPRSARMDQFMQRLKAIRNQQNQQNPPQ